MEDNKNSSQIILYQDDKGNTKINVQFQEDIWLTQKQIAEI